MREIKFRVYGKENKFMYAWDELLAMDSFKDHMRFAVAEDRYYSPLMQYTGLKDKNGTEIYEGDVLDTKSDTVQIVCWDERQAKFKSVPLYLYHFNAGTGGWTGYNLYNRELEVIGNIHQKPELLTN